MPKAFKPSVLTANDLLKGDVIYLNGETWVRDLADAEVLTDEADAEIRLLDASAQVDKVVGVYLITVDNENDTPQTTHFREAFRATGPSNYAHGKRETA
ncbi:MAG: DUF2849 domain-containing protein [Sulfitobacter sp.]